MDDRETQRLIDGVLRVFSDEDGEINLFELYYVLTCIMNVTKPKLVEAFKGMESALDEAILGLDESYVGITSIMDSEQGGE